jgi:hypothetical protein
MRRAAHGALFAVAWLALSGCDSGPQTLGWEGASTAPPLARPWFEGPSLLWPMAPGFSR